MARVGVQAGGWGTFPPRQRKKCILKAFSKKEEKVDMR